MSENKVKTPQERSDTDLLELVSQLSARLAIHDSKELHDAYWEARNEMDRRLKAYSLPKGNGLYWKEIKDESDLPKEEKYYWTKGDEGFTYWYNDIKAWEHNKKVTHYLSPLNESSGKEEGYLDELIHYIEVTMSTYPSDEDSLPSERGAYDAYFNILQIAKSKKVLASKSSPSSKKDVGEGAIELLNEFSKLLDELILKLPTGKNRNDVTDLNIKVKSELNK